jgi:hypothetical protein
VSEPKGLNGALHVIVTASLTLASPEADDERADSPMGCWRFFRLSHSGPEYRPRNPRQPETVGPLVESDRDCA